MSNPFYKQIKAQAGLKINATCQITAKGELQLYGIIGDWWDSLDAQSIVNKVNAMSGDEIIVRIHSQGGSVLEGFAIINALKATGKRIVAYVDGVAASMAAFIALSADHLIMPENSFLMIHKARADGYGETADERRRKAETLDKFDGSLSAIVAAKTGMAQDEVLQLMTNDYWISAKDAVAQGYADELTQELKAVASLDYSQFSSVPEQLKSKPITAAPTVAEIKPTNRGDYMLDARAKAVGLSRNKDEDDAAFEARIVIAEKAAIERAKADAQAKILEDERKRVSEITALCSKHGVDAQAMLADGSSIDAAREQVLAQIEAKSAAQVPVSHVTVVPPTGKREAIVEALLHRANPIAQLSQGAREFRGLSMVEVAKEVIAMGGSRPHGLSPNEVFQAAISTSDMPNIMLDVANKIAIDNYRAQPQEWKQACSRQDFSDFRPQNYVQLGGAFNFDEVPEGGEFKRGKLADAGESITPSTRGNKLMLTRQLIINDDLNAFARVARMIGANAALRETKLFYEMLAGGVTMADNKPLYHADHKNIAAQTKFGEAGLDLTLQKLEAQTVIGGKDLAGLRGKYVFLPRQLQLLANKLIAPVAANSAENVSAFADGSIAPIASSYLTDATAYYTVADPSLFETFVYGYLSGEEGVQIVSEVKAGEGVEYTAWLDFGIGCVDYRGVAKNAGAAQS